MRKKPETILLAKIRRHIRNVIDWHDLDDGMPEFWTTENYKKAKKCTKKQRIEESRPYYIKSSRAIEDIAKKILRVVQNATKLKCKTHGEIETGNWVTVDNKTGELRKVKSNREIPIGFMGSEVAETELNKKLRRDVNAVAKKRRK